MNKEELKKTWENFCKNKDFQLNPKKEHIDFCIDSILQNEKKFGLKLCPCRLRDNTKERDLKLLCPCNFQIQNKWNKKGECWCGLFIKKQ